MTKGKKFGYFFVFSALVINIFVILGPGIANFLLSFTKWSGLGVPEFVGIEIFIVLFSDRVFWIAVKNNLIWTGIFLTVPIAMALLGAHLLKHGKLGEKFLRTIYFLPRTLPIVIVARIWQFIYHPLNGLGSVTGISFLGNPDIALYFVALANIWAWWGFLCVVFYSAMQEISPSLYEVAELNGANQWQEFIHVTLPGIMSTFVFMIIMTIIWSFLVFDWVWVLTEGGPGHATELLATLLYKRAFYTFNAGQAAAIGVVISIFGSLSVIILFVLRRRGWEV